MPKVTVNFANGAPLVIDDAPEGITDIQVAQRIRDKFPDKQISGIEGAQPATLSERLKMFATAGQKDIATKDLPQLALGAADALTLGQTANVNPPQGADEERSRNSGRSLPLGMRAPANMLPAIVTNMGRLAPPAVVRGAAGRFAANAPQTFANAAKIAAGARPAVPVAAGANPAVNNALLRAILRGGGIGVPGADLAYHLYRHFFP